MGPDQTYQLLHSKGNQKQNKKTTYGMGENICKWRDRQRLNFQNIQKFIQINVKNNKTTQSKKKKKSRRHQ